MCEIHFCRGSIKDIRKVQKSFNVEPVNMFEAGFGLCQQIPSRKDGCPRILISLTKKALWDVAIHEIVHAQTMFTSFFGLENDVESDEHRASLTSFIIREVNWTELGYDSVLNKVTKKYF